LIRIADGSGRRNASIASSGVATDVLNAPLSYPPGVTAASANQEML
jgi:hypothetical protein